MGHCESATTYIAIQINFKQLLLNLKKSNFKFIHDFITNSKIVIIDSNGSMNEDFYDYMDNARYKTQVENEELTFEELKKLLSYSIWHDEFLALPMHQICYTERWGYSREGRNTDSAKLDLIQLNKYINECEKYILEYSELQAEVVWLTVQNSD